MKPQSRVAALIGIAVLLLAPYLAVAMYVTNRLPPGNWPVWYGNAMLAWFVTNILILAFLARRFAKKQQADDPPTARPSSTKTKPAEWILRIFGSYLVLVWSVLFLIGVKGTIEGKYELARAIPAGAFLLFFIGIFARSIYRSLQKKP